MSAFSPTEINLIYVFNNGVREWLIDDLKNMVSWLAEEDQEMRDLAEGIIDKLTSMTDKEFSEISKTLVPDALSEKNIS